MSGRCYACGDEFSKFFSGEKGCKNCGFEFCKKCITKKIAVPKLKNEKHHVCDKCYKMITKGEKAPKAQPPSPPKVFQQRLEKLDRKDDKTARPSSSTSSKTRDKYAGMDPVDADLMRRHEKLKEGIKKNTPLPDTKEIETRLSALKADKPAPPSEAEMRERLAKLQGKALQSQQPQRFTADKRTNEEQIIDLMDELFDEHVIDQRQQGLQPDTQRPTTTTTTSQKTDTHTLKDSDADELKEIHALIEKSAKELQLDAENAILSLQQDERLMSRLKELKKKPVDGKDTLDSVDTHTMDDGNSDEEDEDAVASKLIKQYLAEAKLDEDTAKAISESKMSMKTSNNEPTGSIPDVYKPQTAEEDELPWCCICNDDAKMRCLDCDGDLFCAQCFGEAHKESYMKDHDFERYRKR